MARTTCFYGESGTFKSSNCGFMADHICTVTGGGIVRLLTADSGFSPMKNQIDRRVIQPWLLTSAEKPLACLMLVAQGFWPVEIDSKGVANEATLKKTSDAEWKYVGGYVVEGLKMIADLIEGHLMNRQQATGEPLQAIFFDMVGNEMVNYADSSRGTYKFVQSQTRKYVQKFSSLPCHDVVFTSHESKGEDDTTGANLIVGPALAGKAKTRYVSSWFENTFHFQSYMFQDPNDPKRLMPGVRAFFERHPDPDVPNIFWPAKLGFPPDQFVRIKKIYTKGYVPLLLDEHGECADGPSRLFSFIDQVPEIPEPITPDEEAGALIGPPRETA